MHAEISQEHEWLETDGLGGFASGTTSGLRTRRYHALLLASRRPPTDRCVLVNGAEAWVHTPAGRFSLTAQRYGGGIVTRADVVVESFSRDPWPRWVYRLPDGTRIAHELFARHGASATVLTWKLLDARPGVTLGVRPLISGRDYHSLHQENLAFRFDAEVHNHGVRWTPYPSMPTITARHNGRYQHAPLWYRRFEYEQEQLRGFDCVEDLASPGTLWFDLSNEEAGLMFSADTPGAEDLPMGEPFEMPLWSLRQAEAHRRAGLGDGLGRAADAYLVRRGNGRSIIAGYPWFADWGRDTFVSIRGLCLATGRLADAGAILHQWALVISEGMLPNRFPDDSGEPEYNSVDASLWFVIAAHEYMERASLPSSHEAGSLATLGRGILDVVTAYAEGTRYGIGMTSDGLLAAGEPGVQLTWMDARVGDRVITPRIGKPVEVQALWINALWIAASLAKEWTPIFERARRSFQDRFWNADEGCLFDVIDCDHVTGRNDPTLRPNQILAVGGLPLCLLDPDRARRVVDRVEARLLTPLGLATLPCDDPAFCRVYAGGPEARDRAYHQGTVWPWLLGPFVEAWLRVREDCAVLRRDARERFLTPILRHLDVAGLGHVSEVADGTHPHRPGGCPFQAWSVAELLRLDRGVLVEKRASEDVRGSIHVPGRVVAASA